MKNLKLLFISLIALNSITNSQFLQKNDEKHDIICTLDDDTYSYKLCISEFNGQPDATDLTLEAEYLEDFGLLNEIISPQTQLQFIQINFKLVESLSGIQYCFKNSKSLQKLILNIGKLNYNEWDKEYINTIFQSVPNLQHLHVNFQNMGSNIQIFDFDIFTIFKPIENQLELFQFETNLFIRDFYTFRSAFDNQLNLKEINFNVGINFSQESSITTLRHMFNGAISLEKLKLQLDFGYGNLYFDIFEEFLPDNLKELDFIMENGHIKYLNGFEAMTFNLENLKIFNLSFQNNYINDNQIIYLKEAFSNIPQIEQLNLNLNGNYLTNVKGFSDIFVDLHNLKDLQIFFSNQNQKLQTIEGIQGIFDGLTEIQTLSVIGSFGLLTNIDPLIDSLYPLQNLRKLNLNFKNNCINSSEQYKDVITEMIPYLDELFLQFNTDITYDQTYCEYIQ